MKLLPSFGPHPCPVYLRFPYKGENSIRLAKQASLAIKSTFNSVSLRVVYNTNRPLNGIVKDATFTDDLSSVVYIFKCYCGNDYVGRTSQRFHVRREQHVTKMLFLMTTLSQKVNNHSSINTFSIYLVALRTTWIVGLKFYLERETLSRKPSLSFRTIVH